MNAPPEHPAQISGDHASCQTLSRRRFMTVSVASFGLVGLGVISLAGEGRATEIEKPFNRERATQWMRRAIELSRKAMELGDGFPFGSVIAKEGEIVGEGWNRSWVNRDPSAHAEIEAIRDACKRLDTLSLEGCDVYASAQPCPMCIAAIYWAGANRIFFGNSARDIAALDPNLDATFIYQALTKPAEQRPVTERELLREEVMEVFRGYAAIKK
ncbi:nucleoside deaminase [Nitrosococcus watsonii]|nr:nucleoside deaminase [Nitrosococcus watsonii]